MADNGIQVFKDITHTALVTLEEPVSGGSVWQFLFVTAESLIHCITCWCQLRAPHMGFAMSHCQVGLCDCCFICGFVVVQVALYIASWCWFKASSNENLCEGQTPSNSKCLTTVNL